MKTFEDLKSYYDDKRTKYDQLVGYRRALNDSISKDELEIEKAEKLIDKFSKTSIFLQKVSESFQKEIVSKIETIITTAIQEIVKNPNLFFKVKFSSKRSVINVDFKIYDRYIDEEYDILHSFGGTLADIISTILRPVLLELYDIRNSGLIVYDENGKWINGVEYQENYSVFLADISRRLNRQILFISQKENIIDKASIKYKITKNNGISSISKV